EIPQALIDHRQVSAAEEQRVDEERIKLIDGAAFFEAGRDRPVSVVLVEKRRRERPEELDERELDLRMGVVDRRIDDRRELPVAGEDVAGPEIAVDERGMRRLEEPAIELLGKAPESVVQRGGERAAGTGERGEMQQPVIAVEGGPRLREWVR